MTLIPYTWTRGSSFTFGLQVRGGSLTGSETVRCAAKAVGGVGFPPPGDDAAELVVFTSTFVPASGKVPAHWLFSASAEQSLALTPGVLIADARVDFGAGVILQVAPCYLQVTERVTEAT